MPTFRLPIFLRPRRSLHQLHSFHLSPDKSSTVTVYKYASKTSESPHSARTTKHIRPLGGFVVVIMAILASLLFIFCISLAFVGAQADVPLFMRTLNTVGEASPGLVLIGENVDVDVDEPSITIRWSIIACGKEHTLPGSTGIHGSASCGLPALPLSIFVDNNDVPAVGYNPALIPFNRESGQRRSIQNLVQFDSSHALDAHQAPLYPFDTYFLSSTLRATSAVTNQTITIRRILTIDGTSNFDIITTDIESYRHLGTAGTTGLGSQMTLSSRDIDMHIARPSEARCFTLLLFGLSWALAHMTIGHVVLARRLKGICALLPHLASSGTVLIVIPQLRASMPGAPGFDGVLIDSIGYLPQMAVAGLSATTLLLMLTVRSIDVVQEHSPESNSSKQGDRPPLHGVTTEHKASPSPSLGFQQFRAPTSPNANSTSMDVAQWEMYRLMKEVNGQYVFPPIKKAPSSDRCKALSSKWQHRRAKSSVTKIMESGEVSRWSGSE